MSTPSLLTFPCELPIKIFGRNEERFRAAALAILRAHYANVGEADVTEQPSRRGRYLSLTVTVRAASRDQVDALYRELTASEDILMVL